MMTAAVVLALSMAAGPSHAAETPATVAEIAGIWAGTLTHAGETEPFALELEPGTDGKVLLRMSVPVAHLDRAPIGRVAAQVQGPEVRLGPFVLRYDRGAKTLSGVAPRDLVPGATSRSCCSSSSTRSFAAPATRRWRCGRSGSRTR